MCTDAQDALSLLSSRGHECSNRMTWCWEYDGRLPACDEVLSDDVGRSGRADGSQHPVTHSACVEHGLGSGHGL